MKLNMLCFFLFFFAFGGVLSAQEVSGTPKVSGRFEDIQNQLVELKKGQEELLKEMRNLKEELHIIKIRVTHR